MIDVIAIFCSDFHLTETAPPARSAEPDWMEAQDRMLRQLVVLAGSHVCPIICAGDLFDRHNPSPALINWTIDHLPKMYAVPGQHDLPHHRYEDVDRSAYWTLVKAGMIIDLNVKTWCDFRFYGFPWEVGVREPRISDVSKRVAVSHRFVWTKTTGYSGAPDTGTVKAIAKLYEGYDVAVFGDNHQGFSKGGVPAIFNCGCLIRRKANERGYKPRVGLLRGDGTVDSHFLDISEDVWADQPDDEPDMPEMVEDLRDFIAELKDSSVDVVDFEESVNRWMAEHDCSDPVRKILKEVVLL